MTTTGIIIGAVSFFAGLILGVFIVALCSASSCAERDECVGALQRDVDRLRLLLEAERQRGNCSAQAGCECEATP